MPALARGKTLTTKERKLLAGLADGLNMQQASLAAGYKWADQAHETLAIPRVQTEFQKIIEKSGVTDDAIAKKLKTLLDAKKVIGYINGPSAKGAKGVDNVSDEFVEVPDNVTQLNAVKVCCQIKGHLASDKNVNVNIEKNTTIQQINIEGMGPDDLWNALNGRITEPKKTISA